MVILAKEKDRHKDPDYKKNYNRAHYDSILVQYKHELNYKERIKLLADDEGISVNAWILRAIDNQLRRESGELTGEE